MNIRGTILFLLLGVPAGVLLLFGPGRAPHVPADRVVIRYWEKWSGVEGLAIKRLVNRFNDTVGTERNIWVDYCAISNIEQRLLIATAGGDPPDVAGVYDYSVPQYADQGALLPLDELVRDSDIRLESFKPIWLDIGRYEDRLMALPSTPYTIVLYYNRRLFREAGLDPDRPPRTTAELNEYALRLTRRDPADPKGERIAQLGFTSSPAMLGWWHWIWPNFFDGRLWDGKRFTLDAPAGRAAVQWIAERRAALGNRSVLEFEATSGAIEGAQNPFLSERLAMVFQGPWLANWAKTYAPNLDYGVAAFPSVTAERQNVFASTDMFVIPRGSRHPRQAMVFLEFMLRQEHLEELCREHGKASPFRMPCPDFFAKHPNPHIRTFDGLAASEYAFGYPKMPMWAQAWSELLALHESILRGVQPPLEALRDTQAKIDHIVEEYQSMAAKRRGSASVAANAEVAPAAVPMSTGGAKR
ncbi:MAG: ABC transporter substrate-binding protein [Planctomycetota bacterium]